jgi:hypothetical protein
MIIIDMEMLMAKCIYGEGPLTLDELPGIHP